MKSQKIKYLIDHYLHLLPKEATEKIRYPYLTKQEEEKEKLRLAALLITAYSDKIILNECPNCGELARTPQAKQCRWCGHDWHEGTYND